jgi:hypothetical protein
MCNKVENRHFILLHAVHGEMSSPFSYCVHLLLFYSVAIVSCFASRLKLVDALCHQHNQSSFDSK